MNTNDNGSPAKLDNDALDDLERLARGRLNIGLVEVPAETLIELMDALRTARKAFFESDADRDRAGLLLELVSPEVMVCPVHGPRYPLNEDHEIDIVCRQAADDFDNAPKCEVVMNVSTPGLVLASDWGKAC
jgi:hypothetical protein